MGGYRHPQAPFLPPECRAILLPIRGSIRELITVRCFLSKPSCCRQHPFSSMPMEIEPSSFPSITSIGKRTKYVHKLLQYRLLNESELELVTETFFDVLKSIDLRIPNKRILELAYGRRALIDQEQEILKFPRNLVAQSIGSAGQKNTFSSASCLTPRRTNTTEYSLKA